MMTVKVEKFSKGFVKLLNTMGDKTDVEQTARIILA